MCVDFAYKQKQQGGDKWGLRNIKLRMSRKLIFVKGFLMCFKSFGTEWDKEQIKETLWESVASTPLEFILPVFLNAGVSEAVILKLLDAYDKYLGILNDDAFRKHLASINMRSIYGDERFEAARSISHQFQESLDQIFFHENSKLREFTVKYGLF
jgi:hypothetical protein